MTESRLRTYQGAVAIVTGAASGIGLALAEELARRGADVTLADLQSELCEAAAASIRQSGGSADSFEVDVADTTAVELLVGKACQRAGRLDYLFNNAGIGIAGPVGSYSIEDWDRIIATNVRGVVNGFHSAYPLMLRQGFGHIVNTASMDGLTPTPGMAAYSATKHAVIGFSTSARAEVAGSGIRVTALCPGLVHTPMLAGGGKYGKVYTDISPAEQLRIAERLRPMKADRFAARTLDALPKNPAILVIPSWWRLLWLAYRLSPTVVIRVMQKALGDSISPGLPAA